MKRERNCSTSQGRDSGLAMCGIFGSVRPCFQRHAELSCDNYHACICADSKETENTSNAVRLSLQMLLITVQSPFPPTVQTPVAEFTCRNVKAVITELFQRDTQHVYEALGVKALFSFGLQVWNSAVCPHKGALHPLKKKKEAQKGTRARRHAHGDGVPCRLSLT